MERKLPPLYVFVLFRVYVAYSAVPDLRSPPCCVFCCSLFYTAIIYIIRRGFVVCSCWFFLCFVCSLSYRLRCCVLLWFRYPTTCTSERYDHDRVVGAIGLDALETMWPNIQVRSRNGTLSRPETRTSIWPAGFVHSFNQVTSSIESNSVCESPTDTSISLCSYVPLAAWGKSRPKERRGSPSIN